MGQKQIEKFAPAAGLFRCPICHGELRFEGGALRCVHGHTFNVAAKGSVNFIPNQRPLKGYDRAFFENRRAFMEGGFYAHVLAGLVAVLRERGVQGPVVDAGCGEGYYAKGVSSALGCDVVGIDLAKEAVQVASSGGNAVLWAVADLANIPLASGAADCLLNVFTPANYAEFSRVLVPGGLVAKVVPAARHLEELRAALRGNVRHDDYSNQDVVDYFERHFAHVERVPLEATYAIAPAQLQTLLRMTPLTFGVSQSEFANCSIDQITVAAELLVGRV